MVDTGNRPHIPNHICCCPFNDLMILSQTNASGYWSLACWTSWYHCLKNTLVFPGVASPLKVLILGVPILSPAVSVLRRWPTFALAQGGLADCCMGSPGPHPSFSEGHFPVIHVGYPTTPRDPQDCPRVTHVGSPPTSWLPLTGHPPVPLVVIHHQGPGGPWVVLSGAHCISGAHWGEVGSPPLHPGQTPVCQRVDCSLQ